MPVIADLGALFVAFCVFLICWLLLQGYRSTFGALLGHLAAVSRNVSVLGYHPFRWLGDDLEQINHFILLQLAGAVEGSSRAWHVLVGQTASFVHETADAIADLAEATQREFQRIATHAIPATITGSLHTLRRDVAYLRLRVAALAATVAALPRVIPAAVTHEITKVVTHVERVVVVKSTAVTHTITRAIAIPLPRVGALERDVKGLEQWVRSHKAIVTEATFAGLTVGVLSRLGLGWTRCSNTKRYGQNICGMDPSLLESLIADTVLILGTVSLVEFATGMQTVVSETESAVATFWRA